MLRRAVIGGALAACLPLPGLAQAVGIYVADDGDVLGPFDEDALGARIRSQAEATQVLVWHQGMTDWAPADRVPALAAFVAALPAETPIDFAAFVLGNWVSTDRVMALDGGSSVIVRETLTLKDDKTYEGTFFFEDLSVVSRPATVRPFQSETTMVPQRPPNQIIMDQRRFSGTIEGKYSARTTEDHRHLLSFRGDIIDRSNPMRQRRYDHDSKLELRIVDELHMRSIFGENFYRQ